MSQSVRNFFAAVALTAAAIKGQYARAEPEKPETQAEWEARRKADAEKMRLAEEAAEKAEHDRILQELKNEIAEAEAEKKAEAERTAAEAREAQRKQEEVDRAQRIGTLLSGSNTQLPASRLNHAHFEIKANYDFKNSGFDGDAALKFGLGKQIYGHVEIDGLQRKLTFGDADGTQKELGAYLGLTSPDFTLTFNNQYGETTLDESFTGSEDITSTLVSTTNSSNDQRDTSFLQSANVEYRIDDIFNIGLRGTRIKGREKNDTHVVVNTVGSIPNPLGGPDILIDETAEADANVRSNITTYAGRAFIEGKLSKGFALHARFRFVENNIETKLNGDTVLDEKERRVQGLLRARLANTWAQLVVDGGYQKMLDGPDKNRNSHYLGATDLSIRFHDQVLGQVSGWYDENRQYGGSVALAIGQKSFGNSALADFARGNEALRDITFDESLSDRQRVKYKRLVPERFNQEHDAAVFRFSIDGDGNHHLYSVDAIVPTSVLLDGTSVHTGFTGGRGYKGWFGKFNVEFSDSFSGYVYGAHEQDAITDTRSTAFGLGVVYDFGPSENDK